MAENSNYVPEGRNPSPSGFQFNNPTIISLLYLAGYITGWLTALIGLVLAYVWKGDRPAEWERSHYSYHIRTFWVGFLQAVIATVLAITLILIPVAWMWFLWIAVWTAVRTIKAMLAAQRHQPITNPTTWLW